MNYSKTTILRSILIVFLINISTSITFSQSSINTSANTICGENRIVSYSIGQVFAENLVNTSISVTPGVQQAVLSTNPNQIPLSCFQSIIYDQTNCGFNIVGEMPQEPLIDCYETIGFDYEKCEWSIKEIVVEENLSYYGCSGDGYTVIINGTEYSESNPSGIEMFTTVIGCDSIVNINLAFEICDVCKGFDNILNITIRQITDSTYEILNHNYNFVNRPYTLNEVIEELLIQQTHCNQSKSKEKQTHYVAEELMPLMSRLIKGTQLRI